MLPITRLRRPCSNDGCDSNDVRGIRPDGLRDQDSVHASLVSTKVYGGTPSTSKLPVNSVRRRGNSSTLAVLSTRMQKNEEVSIEINRRISVAWERIRKLSSQPYDKPNAELSLKVRLLKAEVIEAQSYGCATWTLRSEDSDSLRIAHHKLLLRVVGFRRKGGTGYKPLFFRTERCSR